MFKFKKKEEPTAMTIEPQSEEISTEELIEQIHNEFNNASDELLREAQQALASLDLSGEEKADRLSKLGFSSARGVKEVLEEKKKKELSQEQIQLVTYYRENYEQKFIVEEQITEICKKYGLVCGEASRYKGFVPEKNLREIESFKGVKPEDALYTIPSRWGLQEEYTYDEYKSQGKTGSIIEVKTLSICAPLKDMEVKSGEYVDENNRIKQHIPDPVVLYPCRGGFLVLTAWGDESEDPILQK